MRFLRHDLRHAVRQLLRTPGFTAAAVLTLALGIGANTAFFAVVNAIVYRPMRSADFEDVSTLYFRAREWNSQSGRIAWLRTIESAPPAAVEAVAAVRGAVVLAHIRGHADRVGVEQVTGGYRDVIRLNPQAGRFISTEDEAAASRVVVISDRLWRDWFGADRAAVSAATITIFDQPFEVVGVAPAGYQGFLGFTGLNSVDLWMPMSTWERRLRAGGVGDGMWSMVLVRTAPGTQRKALGEEIKALVSADTVHGKDLISVGLTPLPAGGPFQRMGEIVLSLSLLVLFAACANLANMLFARGASRRAELAIRRSLGATSLQLFRMLLVETAVIACAASALGLAVALAVTSLLNAAFPSVPGWQTETAVDLAPDYRVFIYAFASGLLCSLAVGTLTAFRASRVIPQRALASGDAATSITRTGRRVRLALVAVQVTAALVLLLGAASIVRQTSATLEDRILFSTAPLASARIDLSQHAFTDSQARAFLDRLLPQIQSIPGVERVALTDGIPGGAYMRGAGVMFVAEKPRPGLPEARWIDASHRRANGTLMSVSPSFLSTLDIDLQRGRDFTANDREGAPLVVIPSERVANALWPGQDPIGKRMMLGNEGGWRTVIGICDDAVAVKMNQPDFPGSNMVLVPYDQRYLPGVTERTGSRYERRFLRELIIVVRSAQPAVHIEAVTAAAAALDSRVAVFDAATVDASILSWVSPLRAARMLTVSLALTALAIAILGVYGVLAYLVARRTREFGIRMALGAQPRQVVRMVLDEALHLMLVGLFAGVFVAAVGERLVNYRMFAGVLRPNEISTWVVVPLLLLAIGLLAGFLPARRAAGIDPNVALRDL